jgi:hypothetical protein
MNLKRYPVPGTCPVCGGDFAITQVKCRGCGARLEGRFTPSLFGNLSEEQLRFVRIFMISRGNIREVGKAMGISYPTVRARLDEVIRAMGLTPEPESNDLLEKVKTGEVTPEEAARIINTWKSTGEDDQNE